MEKSEHGEQEQIENIVKICMCVQYGVDQPTYTVLYACTGKR